MAVTVANFVQGPATVYTAPFGTAEPAETTIGLTGAPAVGWVDVGGTRDGANIVISQEFSELEVDQIVDVPGRRITKRDQQFQTNLAEPTLENLAISLNGGTITEPVAAAVKKFVPNSDTSATQPTYRALLFDGWAPNQKRRRGIVRKVLSIDNIEFAYKKDEQKVFTVNFAGHYVSPSIPPWTYLDDITA